MFLLAGLCLYVTHAARSHLFSLFFSIHTPALWTSPLCQPVLSGGPLVALFQLTVLFRTTLLCSRFTYIWCSLTNVMSFSLLSFLLHTLLYVFDHSPVDCSQPCHHFMKTK